MPLGIDAEGQARLDLWAASASSDDQNRVEQLLYDVRWQNDWKTSWMANRDPFERSDWIITVHDELVVVIREFSDEDPQNMIGVWIGPAPTDNT